MVSATSGHCPGCDAGFWTTWANAGRGEVQSPHEYRCHTPLHEGNKPPEFVIVLAVVRRR